jgi:hypothetical protein
MNTVLKQVAVQGPFVGNHFPILYVPRMEVKEPAQEYHMKVVGRRTPCSGGLMQADNLFRMVIDLRGSKPFIPKGVWRFKTFEEAQDWSWKMITR